MTALDPATESAGPKLVYVALGEGTTRRETLDDPDRRFLSYFTNHLEPLGTVLTSLVSGVDTAALVDLFRTEIGSPQIKLWAIDAGKALESAPSGGRAATRFVFEQLRPVMDRVTRKMADEMLAGIAGPEALYAKVTGLQAGEIGLPAYEDPRIRNFVERVVLAGSGALVVNNTFAEWAAVSALRRVEPDLLMVRFARRRRFVPLRQLDPFQVPRSPWEDLPAEDPGESLQDADVLAYYVWLETRKNPRLRDRTHFLIHLEGSRAALFFGPGVRAGARCDEAARPEDFTSTVAHLAGKDPTRYGGKVIEDVLATRG